MRIWWDVLEVIQAYSSTPGLYENLYVDKSKVRNNPTVIYLNPQTNSIQTHQQLQSYMEEAICSIDKVNNIQICNQTYDLVTHLNDWSSQHKRIDSAATVNTK